MKPKAKISNKELEEKKERRRVIAEAIESLEEALEVLLEVADGTLDLPLSNGFTVNNGEGTPTFLISIVPDNIRYTSGTRWTDYKKRN